MLPTILDYLACTHMGTSTVWCSRSVQLFFSPNFDIWIGHTIYLKRLDHDCGVFYAAHTRQDMISAAAILFAGLHDVVDLLLGLELHVLSGSA